MDNLPVHAKSKAYINSIGASSLPHADFGSGTYYGGLLGAPWISVPSTQKEVPVSFLYKSESDPGPYPIPPNAPIEGSPGSTTGDRHVAVVQKGTCKLYELFSATKLANGSWHAGSGAVFDLKGYTLRPAGWTSADAAGLPILPTLVRYAEFQNGEIRHALRFSAWRTRKAYVWPARHAASTITDPNVPPMGQRFRLKKSISTAGFSPQARVIVEALKKYGMILSDNGANWHLQGVPNEGWNNTVLREIKRLKGSDFEAVDTSSLMINVNSGRAKQLTTKAETALTKDEVPLSKGESTIGVVSAASLQPGSLAPGELITIYGANLGPANGLGMSLEGSGRVATKLGGTRVLFDEMPAVITYARQDQINAIVPYAMAGRSMATITIEHDGTRSEPIEVVLLDAVPALFTVSGSGTGQAAVLNQNASVNSEANPAGKGTVVMLYASGEGQTTPPVPDGSIANGAAWAPELPVTVTINGQDAPVEYAGAAPGLVAGVLQVNVRIPESLEGSGPLPIAMTIGESESPEGVTITVE